MKLQWSIQSSHTQLVLSQVVYLNYRNEHIWPPTRKWLHTFEAFHLTSLQFITFDHFWTKHLILRSMPEIFLYFIFVSKPLAFWAPYISKHITFPSSKSNTSICDGFCSSLSLFKISHLLSYEAKTYKKCVRLNLINHLVGFIPCQIFL